METEIQFVKRKEEDEIDLPILSQDQPHLIEQRDLFLFHNQEAQETDNLLGRVNLPSQVFKTEFLVQNNEYDFSHASQTQDIFMHARTNNEDVVIKHELVNLRRLRQLLTYTAKYDTETFEKLLFYYECYSDRFERSNTVSLPVLYKFSREKAKIKLGRRYAHIQSYFAPKSRFGGLQTLPKKYRGFLADKIYWDLDIQNAHPSILMSVLTRTQIPVPNLLGKYVTDRHNLLEEIANLFFSSANENNTTTTRQAEINNLTKNLMIRLVFGSSVKYWIDEMQKKSQELPPQTQQPAQPLQQQPPPNTVFTTIATPKISLSFLESAGFSTLEITTWLDCPFKKLPLLFDEKLAALTDDQLKQKILLWRELLEFPEKLQLIAKKLYSHPHFHEIGQKLTSAIQQKTIRFYHSFLATLLQELERQILEKTNEFLELKLHRNFDVLIHDGGLLRKQLPLEENMDSPPADLLQALNSFVKWDLKYPFVQFVYKPFDLSLYNEISVMTENYPDIGYHKLKYYLETHRDLCYVSQEDAYYLADNSRTHQISIQSLRVQLSKFTVAYEMAPEHLRSCVINNYNANSTPQQDLEDLGMRSGVNEGSHHKTSYHNFPQNSQQSTIPATHSNTNTNSTILRLNSGNNILDDTYSSIVYSSISNRYPSSRSSSVVKQSPASSVSNRGVIIKKRIPFLDLWLKDLSARQYDLTCFSPKTYSRDSHQLSFMTPRFHQFKYEPAVRYIYQGWDLLDYPDSCTASVQMFLELVESLFPKKVERDFVINWIAHLFQYPDERIGGTCLVFISSVQGTGKSTLLNAVLSLMMRYGKKLTKISQDLFDNFTTAMENHVLLGIDDQDSDALRTHAEEFRSLITSDEARIRELYHPTREIITNARFWVTSNRMDAIQVDEEARRFAIFEPAATLKGNQHFFFKWNKRYWCDYANRKTVLKYLLNHKIPEDWHPEHSYPKTSIKRQLQESNLSPIAIYIYSLGLTLSNQYPQVEYCDIFVTPLKKKFAAWCDYTFRSETKKVHIPSKKTFPDQLRALRIYNSRDDEAEHKKGYNSATCYQFPLVQLAEKAKYFSLEELPKEYCIDDIPPSHFYVLNSALNLGDEILL